MEENILETYYAIFFPLTKEYLIVDNYIEADSHRKGVYNLTEKFESKEKALEWIEKLKNGEIKLPEKKKVYYAIYLKKEKEGIILTDPQEVTKTLYKKTAFCKKFSSEEEGLEWIELIKNDERNAIVKIENNLKNIENKKKVYYAIFFKDTKETLILTDSEKVNEILYKNSYLCRKFSSEEEAIIWLDLVKVKEKDVKPQMVSKVKESEIKKKRCYAVFFTETRESFITDFVEKVNFAIKEEKGFYKGFKKEEDAFKWLEQCRTKRRIYYAIFFTKELKSLITFDLEMKKTLIKDKPNINRAFETIKEADEWLRSMECTYLEEMESLLKEGTIFFDMGTGRGIGVEVRVSDYMGNSLLDSLPEYKELMNKYGNYNLENMDKTQYGELFGLYLALLIASENDFYKKIAGDNLNVIENLSKGEKISSKISSEEKELIDKVVVLREQFEARGGEIFYIKGDINPADLGFHKRKKVNKKVENKN